MDLNQEPSCFRSAKHRAALCVEVIIYNVCCKKRKVLLKALSCLIVVFFLPVAAPVVTIPTDNDVFDHNHQSLQHPCTFAAVEE